MKYYDSYRIPVMRMYFRSTDTNYFDEYKDKVHDPVQLVELVNKLEAIDKEYLKDDEASKHVVNNKTIIARNKLYMTFGNAVNIEKGNKTEPIVQSLLEGVSTDPDAFRMYNNDLRYGAYSRGYSTQLGGYIYKILQRVLASITILPTECGTTRGVIREITKSNASKLLNRYIKENGKWVLVETAQMAQTYIDKVIEVRSPHVS